jgi:phenol 2-monooxygenase
VLHQGRIEQFFLDSIRQHSDIDVKRGKLPISFNFEDDKAADFDAYPITVTLQSLSEQEATPKQSGRSAVNDRLFWSNLLPNNTADLLNAARLSAHAGQTELIKAKFMVGCDGAHS